MILAEVTGNRMETLNYTLGVIINVFQLIDFAIVILGEKFFQFFFSVDVIQHFFGIIFFEAPINVVKSDRFYYCAIFVVKSRLFMQNRQIFKHDNGCPWHS